MQYKFSGIANTIYNLRVTIKYKNVFTQKKIENIYLQVMDNFWF